MRCAMSRDDEEEPSWGLAGRLLGYLRELGAVCRAGNPSGVVVIMPPEGLAADVLSSIAIYTPQMAVLLKALEQAG